MEIFNESKSFPKEERYSLIDQIWLDFACDCGYLTKKRHAELISGYEAIGKMLGSMITSPERFQPRSTTISSRE
jgi:hypothetical protein